jgi:hypothetical protein
MNLRGSSNVPVPFDTWERPQQADLVAKDGVGYLRTRWAAEPILGLPADKSSLLPEFLRIANAEDDHADVVLAFAQRWGTLMICERHRRPSSHAPERIVRAASRPLGVDERGDAFDDYSPCMPKQEGRVRWARPQIFLEPISRWHDYARQASAFVKVATLLLEGTPATKQDWRPLAEPLAIGAWGHDSGDARMQKGYAELLNRLLTGPNGGLLGCRKQREFFARALGSWLTEGDVHLSFDWSTKQPVIRYGSNSVMGALTLQLSQLINAGHGYLVCAGCGELISLAHRKRPKRGQRAWCGSQKCKDIQRRLNKDAYLARERTRTKPAG